MILGIDTSCYTTSFALVDRDGHPLQGAKRILAVPEGSRGLAQSAALFQHVRYGDELFAKVCQGQEDEVEAVCASIRPRNEADSYMPVFLAASHWGRMLATAWKVPFLGFSHQEGHLMAGVMTSGLGTELPGCLPGGNEPFLAVHLSGGTTEVLLVNPGIRGFEVKILCATQDIAAGQLADRIGVALGLSFPAGKELDRLACGHQGEKPILKGYCRGRALSFSGAEAAALRFIARGVEPAAIAAAVFTCIANALEKAFRQGIAETGCRRILLVGGVAGSLYLKQRLTHRLGKAAHLYVAPPEYAADNAWGTAWLGWNSWNKGTIDRKERSFN